jgi:proline iminopeptidase
MIRTLLILTGLTVLTACADSGLEPGEGFVDVTGGQVWYRISGSGTGTPLVLLHGGPGVPSYYLKPLQALADERPVILYDQLGAGRSDNPGDPSLWNTARFVEELAQIRETLGLTEVHILGHSWGTMLAVEYMLGNPEGVQSLILASPALSVARWSADADRLLATLPEATQAIIEEHEAAGTTDSPEYQGAVAEYYARYVSLSDPWSADVDSSFAGMNPDIYGQMWGPSEFTSTGSLKTFERAEALAGIAVPILFTTGRYDEATPETVEYYASQAPDARVEILENSAHLTMQDEPERNVEVVRAFLREVESRR